MKRYAVVWLACLLCVFLPGCDQVRYGIHYAERMDDIRSVEIVPLKCQVQLLHTGGVPEPQPELSDEIETRLTRDLARVVKRDGISPHLRRSTSTRPTTQPASSLALANAVAESIITHHYLYGKSRTIDYTLGPAVRDLQATRSDAILCFHFAALVPTEGRKNLQVTAAVVGALAGSVMYLPSSRAALLLMLVDARTGDVLWFNVYGADVDVRDSAGLERLTEKAGEKLFQSRKK